VASAFTLITSVIAKREEFDQKGEPSIKYYINDGLYGSFNCTIFDHWKVSAIPLVTEGNESLEGRQIKHSTVFGPTCDSFDLVLENQYFPEMNIGDWFVFKEMGAYTLVGGSNFNGFKLPAIKYHLPESVLKSLEVMRTRPRMSSLIAQSEFEEFSSDSESVSGDSCLEDFISEMNEETFIAVH